MIKKILLSLIISSLCGCGYLMQNLIVDPINDSIENPTEDAYLLNAKNAKSNSIYDKFTLRENEFSEYLQDLQKQGKDVKKILLDNGGDCDSNACYFYFAKHSNADGLQSQDMSLVINVKKVYYKNIRTVSVLFYNSCTFLSYNHYDCYVNEQESVVVKIDNSFWEKKYVFEYLLEAPFGSRAKFSEKESNFYVWNKINKYLNK